MSQPTTPQQTAAANHEARDRVADLLTDYMSTVFKALGLPWDDVDNARMEEIADSISEMVIDGVRAYEESIADGTRCG